MRVRVLAVVRIWWLVDARTAFKNVQSKKSGNKGQHHDGNSTEGIRVEFKNFRKQIKGNKSEKYSSGQAQNQVQAILGFQGNDPAKGSSCNGQDGEEKRHSHTLIRNENHFHLGVTQRSGKYPHRPRQARPAGARAAQ